MSQDRLQMQRFELKYLVPEGITEGVREFVRPYLQLDEHASGSDGYSYPIHSVYLDADALVLYWDTIKGSKNRFKLRLRFYENQPDAPVYFEIKRRSNDAIFKQRAAVRRIFVDQLLSGHAPATEHLVSPDPKQLAALQRFSDLMVMLRATPKTHVSYLREAWVTAADNSVRVTIDRETRSECRSQAGWTTAMKDPVLVFGRQAVVEIKFTGRFPNWFAELVRVFGLTQCSAAKYVEGLTLLGEKRVRPAMVGWKLPVPSKKKQSQARAWTGVMKEAV